MKNYKKTLKPIIIIIIAILITTIIVGIIAHTNCEEARTYIDNLLGKDLAISTVGQA